MLYTHSIQGGIKMDQKMMDKNWQQLQDNITNFFGNYTQGDMQRIEYKPLFTVHLLESSTGHEKEDKAGPRL